MPSTRVKSKWVGGNLIFTDRSGTQIMKIDGVNNAVTYRAGSAASAGLSPDLWADCPRAEMLIDPGIGHFIGDDFTLINGESFTTAKNYTLAGANGTFTHTAADPNGVALLTATGADNDECNIELASTVGVIKLDATKNWWFETRVKMNQITTAQGVFAGLVLDTVTMGVDFHTDNDMVLKVQSLLGFQVIHAIDAAAIWQSIQILTGGARVAINATLATASTGFVKLGMKSLSGTVTFYVDGVADTTTTTSASANYPLDQYVVPVFGTKCGTAVANTLSVDWWYAAQLRA